MSFSTAVEVFEIGAGKEASLEILGERHMSGNFKQQKGDAKGLVLDRDSDAGLGKAILGTPKLQQKKEEGGLCSQLQRHRGKQCSDAGSKLSKDDLRGKVTPAVTETSKLSKRNKRSRADRKKIKWQAEQKIVEIKTDLNPAEKSKAEVEAEILVNSTEKSSEDAVEHESWRDMKYQGMPTSKMPRGKTEGEKFVETPVGHYYSEIMKTHRQLTSLAAIKERVEAMSINGESREPILLFHCGHGDGTLPVKTLMDSGGRVSYETNHVLMRNSFYKEVREKSPHSIVPIGEPIYDEGCSYANGATSGAYHKQLCYFGLRARDAKTGVTRGMELKVCVVPDDVIEYDLLVGAKAHYETFDPAFKWDGPHNARIRKGPLSGMTIRALSRQEAHDKTVGRTKLAATAPMKARKKFFDLMPKSEIDVNLDYVGLLHEMEKVDPKAIFLLRLVSMRDQRPITCHICPTRITT